MPNIDDSFDVQRFVDAQDGAWEMARAELQNGRKTSHWIWFVFPQMKGLGFSAMSQRYGIASLDEARAYLAHPVLGPRLEEATRLVMAVKGRTAQQVLGGLDGLKFRSSMTLFARAAGGDGGLFGEAIARSCGGEEDATTLRLLGL